MRIPMLRDVELRICKDEIYVLEFLKFDFCVLLAGILKISREPRAGNFQKNPRNYFCKKRYSTLKKRLKDW